MSPAFAGLFVVVLACFVEFAAAEPVGQGFLIGFDLAGAFSIGVFCGVLICCFSAQ
ncbi:hypothetical protein G3580_14255 [Nitrogeniibacter mangrovi]|uniref:Uncharacterized protein n=1 Tax=Nitrogeniibacter mangrovi TaxID=2016596 RepID=A0A6C1B8W8_9RHOO|nr:hypothetical protein [Nitrogeniibacter mangrovi]QID18684.1 hypothetical protein G3580_14255 [Nitrogeniibacter mangrovi]